MLSLYLYKEVTTFIINPADIKKSALASGVSPEELQIPKAVILTFNRPIVEEVEKICGLQQWTWKGGEYSPYSSFQKCWKGRAVNCELSMFVPPMGASPIAAFCEELVYFGAQNVFLLCASWSLGHKYLRKGQIHVPSFAVGLDGTSYHYGNDEFNVDAEPVGFKALTDALTRSGTDWKAGGVGCCEAFYRITREMVDDYRKRGCLSIENGEVAALYSLARVHRIRVGILLQPYIDLEQGLDLSYMDAKYSETCRTQARVAIEALEEICQMAT